MRNAIGMTLLLLCSCEGTETDNPLVDFERTGCKNHSDTALTLAADTAPSDPFPESADYDGLYCFAYEYDEAERLLQVNVYNYPSGCGASFSSARAASRDGSLTLSVERDSCTVARCGFCLYDFAFQVAGVELSASHAVTLRETGCEGTDAQQEPVTLTFAGGASGTYCRRDGQPVTSTCESDDDCRVELERCNGAGVCEPRATF